MTNKQTLSDLTSRRLRDPLTPTRLAYIARLQHEAIKLSDEARMFLSIDPLDDESLQFQVAEVERRVERIAGIVERGAT